LLDFIAGNDLNLLVEKFIKCSLGKLANDLSNQSKSPNCEFDTHIFFNYGILGNTCTLFIPVESATIMNKLLYSGKLKHVNS